ncbi:maltokinase N-terminal cap-like domain-containing protein [Nocardioides sp. R1-1]|uniref:maltokinase N-terminal cap-like domain-containing protein n=1 Tax=Nocardioides sp. R1-1 TaxID=3383502 RepID=UPI0038D23047
MTTSLLAPFLERSRWFGGKGRAFAVTGTRELDRLAPGPTGPEVVLLLVEVTYDDTGEHELYQVPLALYDEPQERLDHAEVGRWPDEAGRLAYDAAHDRTAMSLFLRAFGEHPGFVRLPGHDLDVDAVGSLFSGEQSNSSVLFGEDSVLKLFRRVTPGENPDITTHRVLTEAGSPHIAQLYGWIEIDELQLGMLQQFLRTASDGWDLALASVRDLFAEADLHAEEVGGDFASEAARLGTALGDVHAQLRASFPTSTVAGDELAAAMSDRLAAALDVVPALTAYADAARAVFAGVARLEEVPVQRIHGDLHLGQTLRTVLGWKLVDFEGEPAKPLTERLLPDSPWRDVAGMLRSFDYAPHAVAESMPEEDPDVLHQRGVRADEWARRNRKAFLASYCGEGGLGDADRALLTAYVVDKAVYECVYEARNRPTWLPIPLAGVARLTAG